MKAWNLEAMEAARFSLTLQANLVEMLSFSEFMYMCQVYSALVSLGQLIEISVLVELGSCWRGSKLSCSIWADFENNLIVSSAQNNSKGCSF